MLKNPKSQLFTIELLEYITCAGDDIFHEEIHTKEFIEEINKILNQKMMSADVSLKVLYLIQFWMNFFKDQQDKYYRFCAYYDLLVNAGCRFPPYSPSTYLAYKREIKKTGPFKEEDPFDYYFQRREEEESKYGTSNEDNFETSMSQKKQKLTQELSIVMDNIDLTNSIIDNCVKEKQLDPLLPEMIETLNGIDRKMKGLVEKLAKKNDEDMMDMVLTVIDDINTTVGRFQQMTNRKR